MKIALLFSGQGAQYPGMGKDLYDTCPAAREIFDQAGEQVKKVCFEGTKEELAQTQNTQPCVYTMTMAAHAAVKEQLHGLGLVPAAVAGFSLGEYAALAAAEVFSFMDGLQLVTNRGVWMAEAADGKGGMAASLGDNEKTVELVTELARDYTIQAVNFNCPGQITVAGETQAIAAYAEKAKAKGLKCIPLAVSGPFHSVFMEPVVPKLYGKLEQMALAAPKIPVYSNVTAREMTGDLKEVISKQVASPVKWQDTIEHLIENGVDTFVEIGPGKTLAGLCKKIDKTKHIFQVENVNTLQALVSFLTDQAR